MITLTFRTPESPDTQVIPFSTLVFTDTKAGVTIPELTATARTGWYIFTALD
ncbi:MAG: hypothetical protein IJ390_11115 [Lachnospiraceae bacterium]|nr:hypothetical protein [Lachnospiraceae bacterium]